MDPKYEKARKQLFVANAIVAILTLVVTIMGVFYSNIIPMFSPDIHAVFGMLTFILIPVEFIAIVTDAFLLFRFARKSRQ